MAPSVRRLAVPAVALLLLAGCDGADRTGSAPVAAPPTGGAAEEPTTTSVPHPPDLSDAAIDCSTVEEPCDHGDDPQLDRLWDACAAGDGAACDRLYYDSGFDTRYEQFGNTCGDRDVIVPCPERL